MNLSGYVLKDAPTEELVRAVREIVAGRHYLSPPLSERIIQGYLESIQTVELDAYETLTRREREVLHLVAEGHTNPEIAGLLSISPRTVEDHRSRLMRKLKLDSQIDLVRYALTMVPWQITNEALSHSQRSGTRVPGPGNAETLRALRHRV